MQSESHRHRAKGAIFKLAQFVLDLTPNLQCLQISPIKGPKRANLANATNVG